MKVKYFGNVRAEIIQDEKLIRLSFMKRGKQPLDAKYPARCLNWAITALQPYIDKGYCLAAPEAATSG